MSKYSRRYKVGEYQLSFIKGQERHYVSQRSVNYSVPFHKVPKIFFIDTKIGGTTLSIMTLSITTASIMLKCYTQLKKLNTMTVNVECRYTMSLC
jgi:hypothetical protein